MPVMEQAGIQLDHRFDPKACRHYINGEVYVLHCHHYATLYSQLADDCGMLDGKKLLADVAEDTFYDELSRYYREYDVQDTNTRITIAEQYYSVTGLGQLRTQCVGVEGGEIELLHSHIDEGWIKKWGKSKKAINFITRGYIAGMLAAIFGKPRRSYTVAETESIVKGDQRSLFRAVTL